MAQSCDRIISGLRNSGYHIEIVHFTTYDGKAERKSQQMGGYTALSFAESESHTLNLAWSVVKELGQFDYVASFGVHLCMIASPIYAKWLQTDLLVFLRGNDFDSSIFSLRKREVLQYALESAKMVFTVSDEKRVKIQKWLPKVDTHFVPNGIDTLDWKPTKSEVDYALNWRKEHQNGKNCLGLMGQLKAKKGVHFFLSALNKTNLQQEIHLLLVGDVSEDDQQMLSDLTFSYSILPFQDRFELMKYYMCCDAVVIPSFYDGMPNVMLEAGALGIPIIASAVDGMLDVIDHGKDGLLFKAGNEDDCRKKLYDFISLGDQIQVLGLSLRDKIHTTYTSTHEIQQYSYLLG